jgi:DNA-binding NarL/FixJ family response regulator
MDIHLQRMMDGIAATRLITSQNPRVAVLGLSCDTRQYVVSAMQQAGAFEVLAKEQPAGDLYIAIQRASAAISDE